MRSFSSKRCWETVETTAQDPGWFLVRLIGRVADAYEMTADSQIKIPWGDLHAWYSKREPADSPQTRSSPPKGA